MKRLLLVLAAMGLLSSALYAKDTVAVKGYFESGNKYGTLNAAIDAAIASGTINNTVFKLTPYEAYVLSKSIYIDKGQSLEIVAPKPGRDQNSAPPQIVWTEEGIDRQYIIQTYGDVVMKNVWVRYADFLGSKVASSITFENQDAAQDPERGDFDGCIFDYDGIGAEAAGAFCIKADHYVGIYKNCYWRNNSDNHFRYYGRAVSFPYQSSGWHYDSLFFENCTFTNLSRVVMSEGNEFGSNIQLNHCTILNTVEWVIQTQGWNKNMSITNSIIVNPFMYGYRAADVCAATQTYDDFKAGLCNPPNGSVIDNITSVDTWGFTQFVDFTDQGRSVFLGNNAYLYMPYMLDWYTGCGWCQQQHQIRNDFVLFNPSPMVGGRARAFIDSLDGGGNKVFKNMNVDWATIYNADPQFIVEATNRDTMLIFIEYKWSTAADIDWSYRPDAGFKQIWPLPENLAYNNTQYKTAAMGGFPLGDLNWWPDKMEAWKAQRDAEWATINRWLHGTTGVREISGVRPVEYELRQNYPNPFNPGTRIEYSVPKYSHVSLKVYNILGQEVATLLDGPQQAGNYVFTFDGAGLSSGVYMYRLESEGTFITKKFVLMK